MTGGFELIDSPDGYRLRMQMPPELNGVVDAELFCRGPLLDGSRGNPTVIGERMRQMLGGLALVAPWQVHGTAVQQSRRIWAQPSRVKADGVHFDPSFSQGTVASLRYGDCTPILIAGDHPRPWALILHSGFRGTLANIAAVCVGRIARYYGGIDFRRTHAWIGPAIGPCCYTRRLSDPTSPKALALFGNRFCIPEGDHLRIDLPGIARTQLADAGIPRENIRSLGMCTSCDKSYFYSYRGGDEEDRMILLAKVGGGGHKAVANGENICSSRGVVR